MDLGNDLFQEGSTIAQNLNTANQNQQTSVSLLFCNDKREAVQVQGMSVTWELSRHYR